MKIFLLFIFVTIIILLCLALSACFGFLLYWMGRPRQYNVKSKAKEHKITFKISLLSGLLVVFSIATAMIPGGMYEVQSGEIAVIKSYGQIVGTKGPGLHWKNNLSESYIIYSTKVQEIKFDGEVYAGAGTDTEALSMVASVQFVIDTTKVKTIAEKIGDINTLKSRMQAGINGAADGALRGFAASDVSSKRDLIDSAFDAAIRSLNLEEMYHIEILLIKISSLALNPELEKAINDRKIAEQKAESDKQVALIKIQQELEVAKINAEVKLTEAKAKADAEMIDAENQASIIYLTAKAEADALKVKSIEVARMLGFPIIESIDADTGKIIYEIDMSQNTKDEIELISSYMRYISYLESWDGKLPTVIVGDDTSIIIPMP